MNSAVRSPCSSISHKLTVSETVRESLYYLELSAAEVGRSGAESIIRGSAAARARVKHTTTARGCSSWQRQLKRGGVWYERVTEKQRFSRLRLRNGRPRDGIDRRDASAAALPSQGPAARRTALGR